MITETVTTSSDQDKRVRKLRHDVRGSVHAMGLCLAALETPVSRQDASDFLDDIVKAGSKLTELLDQLEPLLPDA